MASWPSSQHLWSDTHWKDFAHWQSKEILCFSLWMGSQLPVLPMSNAYSDDFLELDVTSTTSVLDYYPNQFWTVQYLSLKKNFLLGKQIQGQCKMQISPPCTISYSLPHMGMHYGNLQDACPYKVRGLMNRRGDSAWYTGVIFWYAPISVCPLDRAVHAQWCTTQARAIHKGLPQRVS